MFIHKEWALRTEQDVRTFEEETSDIHRQLPGYLRHYILKGEYGAEISVNREGFVAALQEMLFDPPRFNVRLDATVDDSHPAEAHFDLAYHCEGEPHDPELECNSILDIILERGIAGPDQWERSGNTGAVDMATAAMMAGGMTPQEIREMNYPWDQHIGNHPAAILALEAADSTMTADPPEVEDNEIWRDYRDQHDGDFSINIWADILSQNLPTESNIAWAKRADCHIQTVQKAVRAVDDLLHQEDQQMTRDEMVTLLASKASKEYRKLAGRPPEPERMRKSVTRAVSDALERRGFAKPVEILGAGDNTLYHAADDLPF